MLEKAVTKLNKAVFGVATESHLVGLHLNNIARVNQGGWNVINAIKPTAVVNLPGGASVEDIARILTINPGCHVFIRPYYVPQAGDAGKEEYIQTVESMIRGGAWNIIPEGQRHLQLWNEQNMPPESQFEGFGVTLKAMILFDKWFCIGYNRIKQIDPTWKIGWTPLTPGNRDVWFSGDAENIPYYMHGLEAARPNLTSDEIRRAVLNGPCYKSLMLADEYLAHIYCMSPEHQIAADWAGLRFVMYAKYFPKAYDVWITECGIGGEPHWICDWYQILQAYPAVKGTGLWKLGAEIIGVNEQIAALRTYTLNLPETPPQPIPWPEPVDPLPMPVPDFVGEPLSGVAPFEVQFTNWSNAGESCRWFFWDNEQSTAWDPKRIYKTPGVFNVTLRLWQYPNEQGEYVDCRKVNYITALSEEPPEPEPPIANFTASPVSGEAPLTVDFTDASLGGEATMWLWVFGDGSFSPSQNPSHAYVTPGNYTVSLTVTGPGGTDILQRIDYIQVLEPEPEPPTVDFYAEPTKGVAPLSVQFINTSTGEYDAGLIQWDFGDGTLRSGVDDPLHVYTESGLYAVMLTLYQGDKSFPLTKPAYIEVLEKPEPEPPKVRKFHFAVSGTVTVTEAGPDEPPIDADISRVSVVEQNGQLYVS